MGLIPLLALALSRVIAASWHSLWVRQWGKARDDESDPGQSGQLFDLKEKMHTDTAGQRKQMMVKPAELAALWKMEKPDQTAIQAKQKELNVLRDQM
jgi:hypothetical protein